MKYVRVTCGNRLRSPSENSVRPVHQPVNQKRVSRRIDRRDAGVMDLEVEVRRRDRALEVLQRREASSRTPNRSVRARREPLANANRPASWARREPSSDRSPARSAAARSVPVL